MASDEIEFVEVPAGEFLAGEDKRVRATASFSISKTVVTCAQYRPFCVATGRKLPDNDDTPMVEVSWDDAEAFCIWSGYRLPTEGEWEKAARGSDGRSYPDGDKAGGCFRDLDLPYRRRGIVSESPYGALAMGDLQEWCAESLEGDHRVLRGGWKVPVLGATPGQEDIWTEAQPVWHRSHAARTEAKRGFSFRVVVRPRPKFVREQVEVPAIVANVGIEWEVMNAQIDAYAKRELDRAYQASIDDGDDEMKAIDRGLKACRRAEERGKRELCIRREVSDPAYAIDRQLVTNTEYRERVRATACEPPDGWIGDEPPVGQENVPVTGISCDEALAYANWLGMSLPTEDEWEVAVACGAIDSAGWEHTFSEESPRMRTARGGLHAITQSTLYGRLIRPAWERAKFGFRCIRR